MPSSSGPMTTSASNVELMSKEVYYNNEPKELAVLGAMEFEVLQLISRNGRSLMIDKTLRRRQLRRRYLRSLSNREFRPTRAYVELAPTILKLPAPVPPIRPTTEDEEMNEPANDVVPNLTEGKQRDHPVVIPAVNRVLNVMSQVPKVERRAPAPKQRKIGSTAPSVQSENPSVFNSGTVHTAVSVPFPRVPT